MSQPSIFHFNYVPLKGGQVDRTNGVIKGVSLITSGVTARGHDLEVDDTTLTQMLECGVAKGQVPVKLNHQSGVENVCGYINNFRIQDSKLLGDWHLLKSHTEFEAMMEKAERMPSCFGLSGAFMGDPEVKQPVAKGGKKRRLARCTELLAVDCVTQPAANPDGLFNAKLGGVDNGTNGNMTEPTLADLFKEIKAIGDRQVAFEQSINDRFDALEQPDPENDEGLSDEQLQQLNGMSDAELAVHGITRAEVNAAVAEAGLAMQGEDGGEGQGDAASAGAGAGSAATPGSASAAIASLQRQVTGLVNHLEAGVRAQEEQEVEHAFAVIESKVGALTTQLAAKDAEIEALRLSIATGETRPLGSGVEAVNLFSAGEGDGAFQQLVTAKMEELMAGGKLTELQAKSQAMQFCIRKHPSAYREFRSKPAGVTRL
ncbi:MAG: hypothetical protein V4710_13525 [Verrucomicrobiota bacterium]